MATFPVTAIIDTFNRANESPLATASNGDSWSITQLSGNANMLKVVTNTARQQIITSGQRNDQYDTTSYGPNSEVYVTLTTLSGTNVQLFSRIISGGSTSNSGYRMLVTCTTGAWNIAPWTNNSQGTAISSGTIGTLASGDSIGMSAVGNTITAWYKSGSGSWTSLGSGTDSTHTGAGNLALAGVSDGSTVTVFDNFGGGTLTSHTITFNNNGGSGSMSSETSPYTQAITTNTFTRTGYTFTGWNTAADGSGTAYADGANYPFTASTTLYAQWTINSYDVIFNANGGSGSMANETKNYNTTNALTTNTFTRTGYFFTGWNTAANGSGTAYADGANYTWPASNTTLYAQWTSTMGILPWLV